METQRKLYESRCRQIINEKNQLDKTKKELIEHKQISDDENKRLHVILLTIKGFSYLERLRFHPKIFRYSGRC